MKDPRNISVTKAGAHYSVPCYRVTNNGIEDCDHELGINFCKGNKANPDDFRQEGMFSESLIEVVKHYLETVNVGELATRETSMVITKLDEALMWMNKRSEDRKRRDVLGTYNK